MPVNDFLPFGTGVGADVMTQAAYAALAARSSGFATGTARSEQCNKVWRQASLIAELITQFIVDKTGQDALDDGTITLLGPNFIAAIQAVITAFGYATIVSPLFTGVPGAPTPSSAENSTRIATTAFVQALLALKAPLASPALTGTPTAPSQAGSDNSTALATTHFVKLVLLDYAPLASPILTGVPQAPTPPPGDNSGKISNTAFIAAALAFYAQLASPTFSGTPTAPTPGTGNRSTRLATTAMFANEFPVGLAGNGWAQLASGFIMQWGLTDPLPAGATTGVTLPRTFPTLNASVVASYSNSSVGDATLGNPFNVCLQAVGGFSIFNGGSADSQYFWQAFGF